MRRALSCSLALTVLLLVATRAGAQQDHPFTLVNVVALHDLCNWEDFDTTFDPSSGTGPYNWADYQANPRIGTNPGCVATDGDRAWVGGFWNGATYFGSSLEDQRLSWYASAGVAEVPNITWASGYGAPYVRFNAYHNAAFPWGGFAVGPGTSYMDWFSGLDYDPATKTLYVAFGDTGDTAPFLLPPGAVQLQTYIAGIDVDPDSPTYGQFTTTFPRANPLSGNSAELSEAGIAVDPLAPERLSYFRWGEGEIKFFDAVNASAPLLEMYIWDQEQLNCNSTAYRGHCFDELTGDLWVRVANAVQWVPRDTRTTIDPFAPYRRFIREPAEGGNGLADTAAQGDDEQLWPVGQAVAAQTRIIGVGPNGVMDTQPQGDDQFDPNTLITSRPVGNSGGGSCQDDPNGFPFGYPNGQGVALVNAANLVDLNQDLVLINNRPNAGAGMLGELRFYTTDGQAYADLEIPCMPAAGPVPLGLAWYDMDYDAASGTLVVVEAERRMMFVYRAQVDGGPAYPRFDYTRNGRVDLHDFAGFQRCFTGPENAGGLTLACMRMNTNSDCDIDLDDWQAMADVWESLGGP